MYVLSEEYRHPHDQHTKQPLSDFATLQLHECMYELGECRAWWGSPDVPHVNILVKAGQYMKMVKVFYS